VFDDAASPHQDVRLPYDPMLDEATVKRGFPTVER
jgi:hypothetical protein